MLKAVIFDIDGVLVDSKEANIYFYQKFIELAGYPPPSRASVLAGNHQSLKQNIAAMTGVNDEAELKRIFDLVETEAVREFRSAELFNFPENLEKTLTELHTKYKLAVVTSRIKTGADDVLDASSIRHLFDVIVAFEDYTNPKPDPEPLLVALKQLGIKPAEAVYIGDSHTDIDAARDAGMQSIHLAEDTHNDATHGIKEFHELVDVIENLVAT